MINCSLINNRQLCFEAFPDIQVEYLKNNSTSEEVVEFQAFNLRNSEILNLFMKATELQRLGVSLTTWKKVDAIERPKLMKEAAERVVWLNRAGSVLERHSLSLLNRLIGSSLQDKSKHCRWGKGLPGMYFDYEGSNIFINIKHSRYLGQGAYGKVRKVIWLNAPDINSVFVAKKTLNNPKEDLRYFEEEIKVLKEFSNKKGIISIIAGGRFDDKTALFLPLYQCTLLNLLDSGIDLSIRKLLNIAFQWLQGVSIISEKGIHGDLNPRNLLLKNEREIEAVISDFGSFRYYGDTRPHVMNPVVASPEYLAKRELTSKLDVWSIGICIHGLFATRKPPCWTMTERNEYKIINEIKSLTPGWLSHYPMRSDTPKFLADLITSMLHPDPEKRPSPQEAYATLSSSLLDV